MSNLEMTSFVGDAIIASREKAKITVFNISVPVIEELCRTRCSAVVGVIQEYDGLFTIEIGSNGLVHVGAIGFNRSRDEVEKMITCLPISNEGKTLLLETGLFPENIWEVTCQIDRLYEESQGVSPFYHPLGHCRIYGTKKNS